MQWSVLEDSLGQPENHLGSIKMKKIVTLKCAVVLYPKVLLEPRPQEKKRSHEMLKEATQGSESPAGLCRWSPAERWAWPAANGKWWGNVQENKVRWTNSSLRKLCSQDFSLCHFYGSCVTWDLSSSHNLFPCCFGTERVCKQQHVADSERKQLKTSCTLLGAHENWHGKAGRITIARKACLSSWTREMKLEGEGITATLRSESRH